MGWKTYRDQWLSEGFAEFSASLYVRASKLEKIRSYWDLKRTLPSFQELRLGTGPSTWGRSTSTAN